MLNPYATSTFCELHPGIPSSSNVEVSTSCPTWHVLIEKGWRIYERLGLWVSSSTPLKPWCSTPKHGFSLSWIAPVVQRPCINNLKSLTNVFLSVEGRGIRIEVESCSYRPVYASASNRSADERLPSSLSPYCANARSVVRSSLS